MAKFCAECGAALEAGDRFCVACGARVASETPAPVAAAVATAPAAAAAIPVSPIAGQVGPVKVAKPAKSSGSVLSQLKWEIVLGVIGGALGVVFASREVMVPAFVSGFATAFVAVLLAHVLISLIARLFKPLAFIAAILLLVGGAAAATTHFIEAPDNPGGFARYIPDVGAFVADLAPVSSDPLPAVSVPQPTIPVVADPGAARAAAVVREATAIGIPVTAAYILMAPDGQETLVVAMSYGRLASALNDPTGLGSGIDAFTRLAGLKTMDLTGLGYLTTTLEDDEGRPIIAISAPTAAVESFRSGSGTRTELIRAVAFKGESRAGLIDALRKQLGQ